MNITRFNYFADSAFSCMNALKHKFYSEIPEEGDSLRRVLYGQVHGFKGAGIWSECISENVKMGETSSYDHYLSPLQVADFIYRNSEIYLENFDEFKKIFRLCCQTHKVTPKENKELSNLNGKVLTRDKYKHLGIILFKNYELTDNKIITPIGYDDYEQKKFAGDYIRGPLDNFIQN